MKKLNKILNDDYKGENWFLKNYFWVGTVIIAMICILLYAFGGSTWNPVEYIYEASMVVKYFNSLFDGFFSCFGHSNWQHALLNMLCFVVVGAYLERKTGTIKLILLVIAFAFLFTAFSAINSGKIGYIGYSGVNFAFYFYVIIDYIFVLSQKGRRTKLAIILGAIIVGLIYLAMCFNGGTSSFGFELYPRDLIYHKGHMSGAVAGTIVGLIVNISHLGKGYRLYK